ncbi:hypothetical protein EOI86_16555 [Hwanghaeella grinnelliae]|uniref:Uncharacterized protein n=1 Tax=Hwanghaeella grinnelliae TaxID=2500179 RepID=A0A3S2W9V8_9PROT|nr:hypothetical protein [Hwanghaeella grinnelliae]RVU36775.1 hypothetical protein EOI86_16555 [Hwanghaeella grinnelliae]
MELALLVLLIDPTPSATFQPINQVYRYVPVYECRAAEKIYEAYTDRIAVCLDGVDEDLSIDEIVALASKNMAIPLTDKSIQ